MHKHMHIASPVSALTLVRAGQFELERELDKLNFEEEDFLAEGDAFFEADVRTCITLTAGWLKPLSPTFTCTHAHASTPRPPLCLL